MSDRILVVGAGLSGLRAAALLESRGHPVLVVEARSRVGGRIMTEDVRGASGDGAYDMGPAWYWPDAQPRMTALVESHGLCSFAQYTAGDVILDRSERQRPMRYRGDEALQFPSMRIAGGAGALAEALLRDLAPGSIVFGTAVTRIERAAGGIILHAVLDGRPCEIPGSACVIAVPPRLAVASMAFDPPLEPSLYGALASLPTWMAGQAKLVAVYDRPFWREAGLSGHARSAVGPLAEIHDASPRTGPPALFGFLARRAGPDDGALRGLAVEQLVRLFGPSAIRPLAILVKDWASDALTATPGDLQGPAGHPYYGIAADRRVCWDGRLTWAGSETAPQHGGYLEGALEAAELAVAALRR